MAAICARVKDPSGEPTRTGIWVGLAAIAMMFAALTSALYVREGSATDWHHIVLPPILWFNTLALIAAASRWRWRGAGWRLHARAGAQPIRRHACG